MGENTEEKAALHWLLFYGKKNQTKKHKPQYFSGKTVHMCNPKNTDISYRMFFYYSEIVLFETIFSPIDKFCIDLTWHTFLAITEWARIFYKFKHFYKIINFK